MAKKSKTVKELDAEVRDLIVLVDNLKEQLKQTKSDLDSKIESIEKQLKARQRDVEPVPKNKTVLKKKQSLKCEQCVSTFSISIQLEKHMKEKHRETTANFKCNKCNQQFHLKWQLEKHLKVHDEGTKFCHYFNNGQLCPFEEFGCAFKHQNSPECFFMNNCKKKMCQYKHNTKRNISSNLNTLDPAKRHEEVCDDTDDIDEHNDSGQFSYDSSNILCEHYCSNCEMVGGGYHMDTNEEFDELKGVNVKNISEHFDGDLYDFMKTYPCNVCEFKCNDIDELKTHVKEKHSNTQFIISCICKTCSYTSDGPEKMIKHIKTIHIKLLKKLVKDNKDNHTT